MVTTYEQAFSDWKYLWDINAAYDMTGGYVDSGDLDMLLKSPTKTTARRCLIRQIEYWFQIGPDPVGATLGWQDDPIVREIAERYDCDLDDLIERRTSQ